MYVCIYICAHTQGTLDYACRAKNIKNTPEINQVQTKKTMMRDMSKYIADLQVSFATLVGLFCLCSRSLLPLARLLPRLLKRRDRSLLPL